MAKKGGAQQLQAEINTDEEFEKFLERPGLLVLDVYSEMWGPSLAMVGSLKKIKLELGGDNLQLAICKADTITALQRFRNKSEPTWLFVMNGRASNLMFGTSVPKLMQMITSELNYLKRPQRGKKFYAITDMQPEEVIRNNILIKAAELEKRLAIEAAEQKRKDYLTYVTDTITANLPDMGVTLFGPQVKKDLFKKIMEPADALKIVCKDRHLIQIEPEEIVLLQQVSTSPCFDPDVLEQLYNKDLLLCFWKMGDDEKRPVEEVLNIYCQDLVKPQQPMPDEFGNIDPDIEPLPPILTNMEVKIKAQIVTTPSLSESIENIEEMVENEEKDKEEEDLMGFMDMTVADEEVAEKLGDQEELPAEIIEELDDEPPSEETLKVVTVPPVWTPGNRRTTAAVIYVFLRSQTKSFLPPDPPPEPPHLLIIFDAVKRKNITNILDKYKDDIMLYGYFSNQEPETATLVANSTKNYESNPQKSSDKLVIKVAKRTSHAVLALAPLGPSYVSPNTVVGKKEALAFFPDDYKTGDMIDAEKAAEEEKLKMEEAAKTSKKTKGQGHKDAEHKDAEHKDPEHKDGEHKDAEHKDAENPPDTGEGAAPEGGEGEEKTNENEKNQQEGSPENSPTGE